MKVLAKRKGNFIIIAFKSKKEGDIWKKSNNIRVINQEKKQLTIL